MKFIGLINKNRAAVIFTPQNITQNSKNIKKIYF